MLDRIKMSWDATHADSLLRDALERTCGSVAWFDPDGFLIAEKPSWRAASDTPGLTVLYRKDDNGTPTLTLEGSPAQMLNNGDGVFGAGAAVEMNLRECAEAMLGAIKLSIEEEGVSIPLALHVRVDDCRLIAADVTFNLHCGTKERAEKLMGQLALVPFTGRCPRHEKYGLYWSPAGRLISPKAYLKGQRLRQLQGKRRRYRYTEAQLEWADGLVRLELQLRDRYWGQRDDPWNTPAALLQHLHSEVYDAMLKHASADRALDEVRSRLSEVYETQRAANLSRFYALIYYAGYEKARLLENKRTFRHNAKLLREAGITGIEQLDGSGSHEEPADSPEDENQLRLVYSWPEHIKSESEKRRQWQRKNPN